jgi:S-formylglutathione hydrolase FrmB
VLAAVEQELLGKLEEDYRIDLDRLSLERENGPSEAIALAAPRVLADGRWQLLAPSRDHKQEWPRVSESAPTALVPPELRKQPSDRGTLFGPILRSEALGRSVRFGMYLPPGYDPKSPERYPVLVLLPGRGNPLSHWTTAGQIVPKLDRMMGKQAQKMIVLIADNTDSYWVNTSDDRKDYERHVIDELIGLATEQLKGDPKRLAIGGISRGGYGAMSIAARNPGRFQSVSAHSAILRGDPSTSFSFGSLFSRSFRDSKSLSEDEVAKLDPSRLADAGAFKKKAPRIMLDVGLEDGLTRDQTLDFSTILERAKVPHQLVVHSGPGLLEHNWDTWSLAFESWIAFHQASFGTPGIPEPTPGIEDVAERAQAELVRRREIEASRPKRSFLDLDYEYAGRWDD